MMIDESTAIHAGLDMIVIVVVFIGLPSMLVIMTDLVQTVPRGSRTGGVVVNLTIVWPSIRTQPVEFFSSPYFRKNSGIFAAMRHTTLAACLVLVQ